MPIEKNADSDELEPIELDSPSDDTLERAPDRVLSFLRGVANNPRALAVLASGGYSDDAHREGWSLLAESAKIPASALPIIADAAAAEAIAALDQWDNVHFAIIASALNRRFSAQNRALFSGLQPGEGAASVLAVDTLLGRLASLAKGKLTDDATTDKEADAYLEKRGYTASVRKELLAQIERAKALPAPVVESADDIAARAAARRAALIALHGWWSEWATLARKIIKRRDLLINLGIGERKRAERVAEPPAS